MKRFRFVLAMFVAMSTAISASAVEMHIEKADYAGIKIDRWGDTEPSTVIMAQYDDEGRLESVKTKALDFEEWKNRYTYEELGFGKAEDICGAKVMLWGADVAGMHPQEKNEDAAYIQKTDMFTLSAKGSSAYIDSQTGDMQIYSTDTRDTTSYWVNADAEMYINGVSADTVVESGMEYLIEDEGANVEFTITDIPDENGVYDGAYDRIDITVFRTAIVDSVDTSDGVTEIVFANADTSFDRMLVEGGDTSYTFSLNGEEIAVSDILPGDVLSIKYDETRGSRSSFFEVYVSRDTIEGKLRSADTEYEEYTFDNGETYDVSYPGAVDVEVGSSYIAYLDVFGRIAGVDFIGSYKKFAILENVYTTNGGADYAATIITGEGKVSYIIDYNDFADLKKVLMGENTDYFDTAEKMAYRADVCDRVIEYSVKTTGELNYKFTSQVSSYFDGTFDAATGKIGTVAISETATVIIDAVDYLDGGDCITITYDELVDGVTYGGYSYGETGSDSVAQFVVITRGEYGLNVYSPMAIHVANTTVDTEEYGEVDAVDAYVNGELTTLMVDCDFGFLTTGDAFFFSKDSDGFVNEIVPVFGSSIDTSYTDLYNKSLENKFDLVDAAVAAGFAGEDGAVIKFNRPAHVSDCDLVFGAIVYNDSSTVGLITKEVKDLTAVDISDPDSEYDIADGVVVYKYDYESSRIRYRVEKVSKAALKKSTFPRAAEVDEDGEIIDFTSESLLSADNPDYGRVNLALLKIVDDEVAEAIVYVPSSSKD